MKKTLVALVLCLIMLTSLCMVFADKDTSRVAIGADLDTNQIQSVYATFGIQRGDVPELTVTNFDEFRYLSDYVDQSTIGKRAISCIYIETTEEGSGLDVTTNNINWCTPETYRNALFTAGINDANVKITAPFPVSGTAALTGIYMAYEDITGEQLDEQAKIVGTEELAITSDLANEIGDEETSSIVNQLKGMLSQTREMTDEELRITIIEIAAQYNLTLTYEQQTQIITLVRSLESLNSFSLEISFDTNKKNDTTAQAEGELQIDQQNGQQSDGQSLGDRIKSIWEAIAEFFRNLFGKGSE